MVLENLSKEELKEICKSKGLTDYANLSRAKLIRILNALESPAEEEALKETVAEVVEEIKSETPVIEKVDVPVEEVKSVSPLSAQALKWRTHLRQLNISPQDYLKRYPDHVYKHFIEELIN